MENQRSAKRAEWRGKQDVRGVDKQRNGGRGPREHETSGKNGERM